MSEPTRILLSERLARGPLPAAEAQQYAASLAEELRRVHDAGRVVGALEPSRIVLNGSTVRLLDEGAASGITPYSSPEQLQGNPPDARSDIFAYGAIVHEMLSGRQAFEGATPQQLRSAILELDPAPLPTEYAEFAKITAKCLTKAPLQRWQRIQRVQMELKMLTVFARRAGQDTAAKADRMQELIRTQIADLEGRLAARIEAHDDKLRSAAETGQTLRAEVAALEARLASGLEKQAAAHESRLGETGQALRTEVAALEARLASGLEKQTAAHESRLGETGQALRTEVAALEARLASGLEKQAAAHQTRLGETGQALRTEVAALEARLAAGLEKQDETERALRAGVAALEARLASRLDAHDARGTELEKQAAAHEIRLATSGDAAIAVSARLAAIDQALKTQSSSIESLESAIAQTDDLVERVVEALDSLERSFAEQNEVKVLAGRN